MEDLWLGSDLCQRLLLHLAPPALPLTLTVSPVVVFAALLKPDGKAAHPPAAVHVEPGVMAMAVPV